MNICLAFIKFFGGVLSGSMGLIADGIHSSSDIVASIALFLGVKLSNRKTRKFPFGMYKLENLISLFTSFVIFFAGYEIIRQVFFSRKEYELSHITIAITIEVLAVLATFIFSSYEAKIGKAEESPGLVADSKHVHSDMFSSIVIIASLIGGLFHVNYLDKVGAAIVALLIFKAGYEVAIDSVRVLLDASVDYKTLDKTKEIIKQSPFVKEIKELNGRNSGSYKFLEAVITLNIKNLERAHKIVSQIENKIKKNIPHVDSVIIHYEPVLKKEQIVAVPMVNSKTISGEFGSAPYFLFLYVEKREIVKKEIITNPYKSVVKGKGLSTAEWLAKKRIDTLFLTSKIKSPGPKYVFEDYEIDVRIDPTATIEKIKKNL